MPLLQCAGGFSSSAIAAIGASSVLLDLTGANTPPVTFTTGNWPESTMYNVGFRLPLLMSLSSSDEYNAATTSYMIPLSYGSGANQCVFFVKSGTAGAWQVGLWDNGPVIQSGDVTWNAADTVTLGIHYDNTAGAAYINVSGAQTGNGSTTGTYAITSLPTGGDLLIQGNILSQYDIDATFSAILTL